MLQDFSKSRSHRVTLCSEDQHFTVASCRLLAPFSGHGTQMLLRASEQDAAPDGPAIWARLEKLAFSVLVHSLSFFKQSKQKTVVSNDLDAEGFFPPAIPCTYSGYKAFLKVCLKPDINEVMLWGTRTPKVMHPCNLPRYISYYHLHKQTSTTSNRTALIPLPTLTSIKEFIPGTCSVGNNPRRLTAITHFIRGEFHELSISEGHTEMGSCWAQTIFTYSLSLCYNFIPHHGRRQLSRRF